jgi:hypothetical protein
MMHGQTQIMFLRIMVETRQIKTWWFSSALLCKFRQEGGGGDYSASELFIPCILPKLIHS